MIQISAEYFKLCVACLDEVTKYMFRMKPKRGSTWNMLEPYGVRQAFRRLSLPVLTNHLPADREVQKHTHG